MTPLFKSQTQKHLSEGSLGKTMEIYNLEEILANIYVIASIMKLILPSIWYRRFLFKHPLTYFQCLQSLCRVHLPEGAPCFWCELLRSLSCAWGATVFRGCGCSFDGQSVVSTQVHDEAPWCMRWSQEGERRTMDCGLKTSPRLGPHKCQWRAHCFNCLLLSYLSCKAGLTVDLKS